MSAHAPRAAATLLVIAQATSRVRTSARKCGRPCCCCGCGLRRSPDAGIAREVARGSRDARAAMSMRARLGAAPRAARNWGLVRPLLPAWPGAPAVVFLAFLTHPAGGIVGEWPSESPNGHPSHHAMMGEEARSRTRAGKHATLGWFSPPHFSRDVARCGHLLFVFAVAGRRPRLAPSLRPPLRAERGRGGRRGTRARRARRACVAVGGSRRRSRAGPFARAAVVSSSLALLPSGRRSSSSSRAFSTAAAPCGARARGAMGGACATRAARVRRCGWFSPPQSSRAVRARRGGLFFSCSSPVPSVAPRARRSFAPPAGRRGARAPRAGERTRAERDATGAACGESERGAPSELAARGFARRVCFCVSGLCCSPLPALRAPLSRSARSGERPLGAGGATHAARVTRDVPGARGAGPCAAFIRNGPAAARVSRAARRSFCCPLADA